jgi:hypothetical protein
MNENIISSLPEQFHHISFTGFCVELQVASLKTQHIR